MGENHQHEKHMHKHDHFHHHNTSKNILIAFLLNLSFSLFELIGGIFTNSIAIISDSIHDFGDALSIGLSYFLEKKSKKAPDEVYTYGYARYSVMGAFITVTILIIGSVIVIIGAIKRIIHPVQINYNGMIIFAIFGVVVNSIAAFATKEGESINQKAVNLHMLEDVLGWVVVLIGSILMKFTDISIIDPIMSIGVAVFILIHSFHHFKDIIDLFLFKIPERMSVDEVKSVIEKIDGVKDAHHIHLWSIDGVNHYATMHLKVEGNFANIKHLVKDELNKMGISHITIEFESIDETCFEHNCSFH